MDETEMSKKMLGGQTEDKQEEKTTANWLADNVVWYVSKKGCGTSVFRGSMVEALMNNDDKRKARSGVKRIESATSFVFARK